MLRGCDDRHSVGDSRARAHCRRPWTKFVPLIIDMAISRPWLSRQAVIWLGIPVLVFVLSFARVQIASTNHRGPDFDAQVRATSLDFPRTIDVGPAECSETKEVRFSLTNGTGSRLQISEFRRVPACACSPVERITRDSRVPEARSELAVGKRAEFVLQVVAVSPVGSVTTHLLEFETSDLRNPRGSVEVRVGPVTGSYVEPATVVLGDLMVHSAARRRICIYAVGPQPRAVARVVSSD